MTIEEKLEQIVKPLCEAEKLYLVEIKIRGDFRHPVFEIYADSEQGITLGQCEKLSRQIQDELDMDDDFQQSYRLDVSSPGLERPLVHDWEFRKNLGQTLQLITESGQKITGKLLAVDRETVQLEVGKGKQRNQQKVKRSEVVQAKVKLQW